MNQAVFRRYSRLLKDKKPLPDVVFIDGGLGQL
jgi:excinuclease ABC subunit C